MKKATTLCLAAMLVVFICGDVAADRRDSHPYQGLKSLSVERRSKLTSMYKDYLQQNSGLFQRLRAAYAELDAQLLDPEAGRREVADAVEDIAELEEAALGAKTDFLLSASEAVGVRLPLSTLDSLRRFSARDYRRRGYEVEQEQ